MSEENEVYVNPNFTPETAQPTGTEVPEIPKEEGAEPSPEVPAEAAHEEEKEKDGVQKRIDELTRKRREAERVAAKEAEEKEYWRKVASGELPNPTPPKPATEDEPQIADFPDYDDFVRALARWETKQTNALLQQQNITARQEEERRNATTAQQAAFERKKDDAAIKYADFDEVINNSNVPVTAAMKEAIMDSDISGDVMYFLAKNPAEAERLAKLPLGAVFREIGKIEFKLATTEKEKPTQAATPINPTSGKEEPPAKPEGDLSDEEWLQKERQRLKKLGRLY